MYAILIAFTVIGTQPVEYIVEQRMDYDVCVEVLADHIEANAPIMIVPSTGPDTNKEIYLHPIQFECRLVQDI